MLFRLHLWPPFSLANLKDLFEFHFKRGMTVNNASKLSVGLRLTIHSLWFFAKLLS